MDEQKAEPATTATTPRPAGVDDMLRLQQQNMERIGRLGTAYVQSIQTAAEKLAELGRTRLDDGMRQTETLRQCSTPQEFFAAQLELMRRGMEQNMTAATRFYEILWEATEESLAALRHEVADASGEEAPAVSPRRRKVA